MDAAIQYFMDIDTLQLSLHDLEKNILSTPEWQEEIKVIKADPDDFYSTILFILLRVFLTIKEREILKLPGLLNT